MGEVFAGRYELVDPIARGGTGAVWRVWDLRRRQYVAAKLLQHSDAHTLLRFVREQALRIDHPHVVAPASWAADDDKVLFTMDLVRGGSLAHLIADYGPLPPRYVCTLLDQLLSGLAAVHHEGVVHRDIKPANILLEARGTARPHLRLSDFGVALRMGEPRLTEANYVMGTPGYFAPEQMMGEEPDFPADLFAVGLVALYLLLGRKPDSEALIQRFTDYGAPNAPEGVPEPLWQVIARLLEPDPQLRFRTATGVRRELMAAVELLPEPDLDDEVIEVFDHLGPLPDGFGPNGPQPRTGRDDGQAEGRDAGRDAARDAARDADRDAGPDDGRGGGQDRRDEGPGGGDGTHGDAAGDRRHGPEQREGQQDRYDTDRPGEREDPRRPGGQAAHGTAPGGDRPGADAAGGPPAAGSGAPDGRPQTGPGHPLPPPGNPYQQPAQQSPQQPAQPGHRPDHPPLSPLPGFAMPPAWPRPTTPPTTPPSPPPVPPPGQPLHAPSQPAEPPAGFHSGPTAGPPFVAGRPAGAHPVRSSGVHAAPRPPGPPRRVVVPMLIAVAVCYVVGVVALLAAG